MRSKRALPFGMVWLASALVVTAPAGADDCQLAVDGRTGRVSPSKAVLPNDKVKICVRPADPLKYVYAIDIDGGQTIVVPHYVVGAGSVSTLQSASKQGGPSPEPDPPPPTVDAAKALLLSVDKSIASARADAGRSTDALAQAATKVSDAIADLDATNLSLLAWPNEFTTARSEAAVAHERLRRSVAAIRADLSRLNSFVLSTKCCSPEDSAKGIDSIQDAVATLEALLSAVVDSTDALGAELSRWRAIHAAHPRPEVVGEFTPRDAGKRHTVTIRRIPIDGTAVTHHGDKTEKADGDADRDVLVRTAFDVHARSRFNVALAIAGLIEPRDQAFGVVANVGSDDKLEHSVQRTDHGGAFDATPTALFGIYLKEVNPFDLKRRPALMAVFGTELSASPKAVLVGLGVDFREGLTINAGLTHYKATELGPGWAVDDPVPAKEDGTPMVASLPTIKKAKVGFFVGVGFRPSIFALLWKKPY